LRELSVAATSKADDSFPLFDWLRFALASVVALGHEGIITWPYAGSFAVQVFFALSGWLIGGILLRTDLRGLPRFYFNRATRIWIPYAFAVAALYLVAAFRESFDPRFLFFDATFTHNWFVHPSPLMPLKGTGAHFWSISVEEQFYLAAPLLIVLLPWGPSITFWAVVATAVYLSGFWYGSISLGVLAAVIRCRYGDWQQSEFGFSCVALACGVLVPFLLSAYDWASPPLALGIVLLTSVRGPRGKVGSFLGGMSYPLYLYHWIGAFVAHHFGLPMLCAYFIALVSGAAAYWAVDRNVMRWRSSFYHPLYGRACMVSAYSLLFTGLAVGLLS
jgi:peptidoglycan/LPS O-acetylase OafA/YrhL